MKRQLIHLLNIVLGIIGLVILISVHAKSSAQVLDKDGTSLSINPTVTEITEVFQRAATGAIDPFRVLSSIVKHKDKAVPALEAFLFASPAPIKEGDSIMNTEPNRLYGVLALEAIATNNAFAVLKHAAQFHPDKEVKGTALNALAGNYYHRAEKDSLPADKEILHILMSNTEDTTWVEHCGRRIGEIAREGVKNWMGEDYGDLPLEKKMIKVGKEKHEMTVEAYREVWWMKHNAALKWNKKTAHFEKAK
jgi:hypothetical protein